MQVFLLFIFIFLQAPFSYACERSLAVDSTKSLLNKTVISYSFSKGVAELPLNSLRSFNKVCSFLTSQRYKSVEIVGYTDTKEKVLGTNLVLSKKRADSVYAEFISLGCLNKGKSVTVLGRGSALPIASNLTEDSRKRNRRVEILIYR